jgi:dTDP-glucose 4,6-dehydratase
MEIKNKKILVTGGAGFIGSALVRELLKDGGKVIVYDNFVTGDLSNLEEVKKEIKIIEGDILDPNLAQIFKENEIDIVFNLAAEPYIPSCYEKPERFFQVNAYGAMNVLLAAKKASVKRILQYSSSEVYGTAIYTPMDESHPTLPCSTYAVSKLAADRLCFTLYHEQKIPIIILRQFNVYGPRETHPYVIPEIITQLNKGKELKLGNIKATRDFTYVEDAAKGSIALMKCDQAVGQTINMGSGKDYSIKEIAQKIAKLMGQKNIKIKVENKRFRPFDVQKLQANFFKMHQSTGWEPKIAFEEGLKRTIEWYKQNNSKWLWEKKIAPEEKIWRDPYRKKN